MWIVYSSWTIWFTMYMNTAALLFLCHQCRTTWPFQPFFYKDPLDKALSCPAMVQNQVTWSNALSFTTLLTNHKL